MKPLTILTTSVLALVIITLFTGCGSFISIFEGFSKKVPVTSNPPGATVTVRDHKGKTLMVTNTPAVVKLKRSSGFFSKASYTLRYEFPGYYPSQVDLESHINGWYFGNILLGGLIGFVIVDPATGSMWRLPSGEANRNLVSSNGVPLTPQQLEIAEAEANPPPKKEYKPAKDTDETKGNRHD